MSVTLNNIANLRSHASQYASEVSHVRGNQSFEGFDCLLNLGKSNESCAHLVSEVQRSLQSAAGKAEKQSCRSAFKNPDVLSGDELRQLSDNFRVVSKEI